MHDRRAALAAAAAKLDAFLARAVEEFGHNACDAVETNRRIDAYIRAREQRSLATANALGATPSQTIERAAA